MARLIETWFPTQNFAFEGPGPAPEFKGAGAVEFSNAVLPKLNGKEPVGCYGRRYSGGESADHTPNALEGLEAFERWYYYGHWVHLTELPSTSAAIIRYYGTSGELLCDWQIQSGGNLLLRDTAATTLKTVTNGLNPAATKYGTGWHYLEVGVWVHSTTAASCKIKAWVDDEVALAEQTFTGKVFKPKGYRHGWVNTPTNTAKITMLGAAVNDDQGASENSRTGPRIAVNLRPASDKARAGFKGGGGAEASLWESQDNTPLTGAASPGTNATQVGSAVSNITDFVEFNLTKPEVAGLLSGATVKLAKVWAAGGNSTITTRTLAVSNVSNPAITEVTLASGTTAAAAHPTGWKYLKSAPVYAPTIESAVAPVLKVRKGTASTDNMMYEGAGLLIEFVPSAGAVVALAGPVTSASSLTGKLTLGKALAGLITDVSALTGKLTLGAALKGAITGVSSLSGKLALSELLKGAVASVSSLTGKLTTTTKTTVALAGSIASTSTLSGKLAVTRGLKGAIADVSALTGKLSRSVALAGPVASVSNLTGKLSLRSLLAGLIKSESELAGKLSLVHAVAPFEPPNKPLLGHTVEIETATGNTYRLTPNGPAAQRPQGLTFGTQRGDGFSTASLSLSRDIWRDFADLNLLDTWRVIDAAGSINYEGRLSGQPRASADGGTVQIELVGWMTYLKSRKVAPLIIDRRLSNFGEWTAARVAFLVGGGFDPLTKSQITFNASPAGAPSIYLGFTGFTSARTELTGFMGSAGGEGIGAFRFDWIVPHAGGEVQAYGFNSTVDTFASVFEVIGMGLAAEANREVRGNNDTIYVGVNAQYPGAFEGQSAGDTYGVAYPRLIGTHGLTQIGSSPNEGYGLSSIMQFILSTYYPKLTWAGDDNEYAMHQASWAGQPAFGYDILQQLNDLVLWELGCWENRRVKFEQADLTQYDWVCKVGDEGVEINLQGESIENFANGVQVTYTDILSGVTLTLQPEDFEALRDESSSNPANIHGEANYCAETVPFPCYEAEALQFGRAYLNEYNRPKRPGSFTINGGWIRNGAGQYRPTAEVRSSQTIGIIDNVYEEPRLITSTSFGDDSKSLTLTVDAPPSILEAVIARTQLAFEGRNIA